MSYEERIEIAEFLESVKWAFKINGLRLEVAKVYLDKNSTVPVEYSWQTLKKIAERIKSVRTVNRATKTF